MSIHSETYALGLDDLFSTSFLPARNLYQLKPLKFRSLKPLLCRTKKLYQITYRLIGTLRIARNIDGQNAYTARVTTKRVSFCTDAHLTPSRLLNRYSLLLD